MLEARKRCICENFKGKNFCIHCGGINPDAGKNEVGKDVLLKCLNTYCKQYNQISESDAVYCDYCGSKLGFSSIPNHWLYGHVR